MRKIHIKSINRQIAFEKYMYFIAIAMPLMTIPQAYQIWAYKSAENIALSTWLAYIISAGSWLAYAAVHKKSQLMINSMLWVSVEMLVIIGILVYR